MRRLLLTFHYSSRLSSFFSLFITSLRQLFMKTVYHSLRCWCSIFLPVCQSSFSLLAEVSCNQWWVISLTFIEIKMILLPFQHYAILVTGGKGRRNGKKQYPVIFMQFDASFTFHRINSISLALLWPFINNSLVLGAPKNTRPSFSNLPQRGFQSLHSVPNIKLTPANNVPTYIRNFN